VYSEFATVIYNRPIDRRRNKGDFIEGQVGKISELGFRFGQGWYMAAFNFLKGHLGAPPIQFKLADMEVMGVDPNPFLANPRKVAQVNEMPSRLELNDRLIHCLVTEYIVKRWRSRNPQNVAFWDTMERVINAMIRGIDLPFGPSGFLHTEHEAIILPSGMRLRYRGLTRDEDGQATYFNGRTREHIYGGSTTNNLAQVLEQEIIGPQMLTVHAAGYKVAVENYDSIVCVVPDEYAQQCLDFMFKTMKQTDAWATGLPLMAEGGIGQTYAEAK
jgi:hypothetical protein